jgi:hypothetical protein
MTRALGISFGHYVIPSVTLHLLLVEFTVSLGSGLMFSMFWSGTYDGMRERHYGNVHLYSCHGFVAARIGGGA